MPTPDPAIHVNVLIQSNHGHVCRSQVVFACKNCLECLFGLTCKPAHKVELSLISLQLNLSPLHEMNWFWLFAIIYGDQSRGPLFKLWSVFSVITAFGLFVLLDNWGAQKINLAAQSKNFVDMILNFSRMCVFKFLWVTLTMCFWSQELNIGDDGHIVCIL